MSTIKNQRCFTEATASARLILATGLHTTENIFILWNWTKLWKMDFPVDIGRRRTLQRYISLLRDEVQLLSWGWGMNLS